MCAKPTKGFSPKNATGNLNRTLKELESAFADWESLGTRKVLSAAEEASADAENRRKAKAAEQTAKEFKKKTQKLLDQLCQQLADLAE